MAKKSERKAAPAPDPEKMSFEQATEELEIIIDRIESGEVGLEEALAERRRGETLIRRCRAILDVAEQELRRIDASDDESDIGEDGSAERPRRLSSE